MSKPEEVFRVGNVIASIFANTVEVQSGGTRIFRHVVFEREYRDAGERKWSSSFSAGDLLNLGKARQLAEDYIFEREVLGGVEALAAA